MDRTGIGSRQSIPDTLSHEARLFPGATFPIIPHIMPRYVPPLSRPPITLTGSSRGPVAATNRIEAFSDGVFSIVITLLILDIHVPSITSVGTQSLGHALLLQWPSYAAYIVSFLLVGGVWANHHVMFRRIRIADHAIVVWNTLHLMFTAVVPFTTALLSAYVLGTLEQRRLAALIYSGVLTLAGICYSTLWRHAIREHLLEPWVTPKEARNLALHWALAPACYAVAFGVAFVSVPLCLALYVLVIGYFTLPWPLQRQMGRAA